MMRYSHQPYLGWFKRMVCVVASIPVVLQLLDTQTLIREPLRSVLITLLFIESVVCLSPRFGWTVHAIIFGFYVWFVPFLLALAPISNGRDHIPSYVFSAIFGAVIGLLFGGAADLDLQWRYRESQAAKKAVAQESKTSA